MPLISCNSEMASELRGVHLFHNGASQCSQRVRLGLAEKGVTYVSHHLDLRKGEHLRAWYAQLNPNLVVPTLVHDGQVIIESNDIISYIDSQFDGLALMPESAAGAAGARRWLALSDRCKSAIRVLSFEYLFRNFARKSATQLERLRELSGDDGELYRFHRRYVEEGLSHEEVGRSISEFRVVLAQMEDALGDAPWLLGGDVSLADIAWLCDVHRLAWMRFPLGDYPRVGGWYERWQARPSFREAVREFEPLHMRLFLRLQGGMRDRLGRGPRSWTSQAQVAVVPGSQS